MTATLLPAANLFAQGVGPFLRPDGMVTHVVRHGRVSPNYANRDRLESDGFPLEGPRGAKRPTCFCVKHA